MDGEATISNESLEQHLLFHKALIDDNVGAEKIDRYLRILNDNPDCETMQDSTDESIRTVFRLVLEENFDPWAIDLREFVRVYSQKTKTGKFNIIVAGKLLLMAWKVLRMQTDATKAESDRNMNEECEFGFDIDTDFFAEEEDPLYVPSVSLREAYRRSPTRPVTMLELLDAFDEAREEMEVSAERERVRLELKAKEPKKFENKAHEELDEKDVEKVWERIQKIGTGAFSLTELYTSDPKDNISAFWSVLQLVRDGKLSVWQDEMPYGEVMVEIKVDWTSGKIEDSDPTLKVPEAVI
jgi:segregation and condensation protein A